MLGASSWKDYIAREYTNFGVTYLFSNKFPRAAYTCITFISTKHKATYKYITGHSKPPETLNNY